MSEPTTDAAETIMTVSTPDEKLRNIVEIAQLFRQEILTWPEDEKAQRAWCVAQVGKGIFRSSEMSELTKAADKLMAYINTGEVAEEEDDE